MTEEYCAIDLKLWTPLDLPTWIFNHDLTERNPWKHRSFTLRLPSETPFSLQKYTVVFELDLEVEELAPAAIRKGTFLTRAMLEFLQKSVRYDIPDPKKKEGSGKGGGLKKEDYAWGAVQHFFKQEPHEEKLRMYNGIMNSTADVVPCPDELLEAIDKLDPLFQEDFGDMKKLCEEQKKRQAKVLAPKLQQPVEMVEPVPVDKVKISDPQPREIQTDAPETSEKRDVKAHQKSDPKLYTPQSLSKLIPGRGELPGVYIKRLPGVRKQYQGFYPGQ